MTLPQKNSRTIVVNNIRYRYVIKNSEYVGVKIVVEVDGITSQCLVGYLECWENYRKVTPNTIRTIITKSIAQGWNPYSKNSGCHYIKELDDLLPV